MILVSMDDRLSLNNFERELRILQLIMIGKSANALFMENKHYTAAFS